jgi:hypothetical protein
MSNETTLKSAIETVIDKIIYILNQTNKNINLEIKKITNDKEITIVENKQLEPKDSLTTPNNLYNLSVTDSVKLKGCKPNN